jgi:hypothetical protein
MAAVGQRPPVASNRDHGGAANGNARSTATAVQHQRPWANCAPRDTVGCRGPTTAGGGVGWRAPRGTPGGGFKYRARFGLSEFLRCLSCRLCPTPETHANPNGDLDMALTMACVGSGRWVGHRTWRKTLAWPAQSLDSHGGAGGGGRWAARSWQTAGDAKMTARSVPLSPRRAAVVRR